MIDISKCKCKCKECDRDHKLTQEEIDQEIKYMEDYYQNIHLYEPDIIYW